MQCPQCGHENSGDAKFCLECGQRSGFRGSRRALLRVGVGMLAALIPVKAGAQPKIAPKLVQYQEKPKGPQECDNCLHFVAPSSCKMVEGKINAKGWCQLYAPKPK